MWYYLIGGMDLTFFGFRFWRAALVSFYYTLVCLRHADYIDTLTWGEARSSVYPKFKFS